MKRILFVLFLLSRFMYTFSTDFLTIYNRDQALYRTTIELDLSRGIQFISYDDIPSTIISESVIFLPSNRNVQLFSQNFEYDLSNTQKMMQRYINRSVMLSTDTETFSGLLVFFDFGNYGLLNSTTNELNIINSSKVNNVLLSEMPSDFYSRPTLRWQLQSERAGKFSADLSYLMYGIDWRATYNVVLGSNTFSFNSWVTINNRSGKDYKNVRLKLISGDVSTHLQQQMYRTSSDMAMASFGRMEAAPSFEERAFSDLRMFTLDLPADIDNNQEKQLTLYPVQTVNYAKKYQYAVQSSDVDVFITFRNSTAAGLGLALPRGNVNFYEVDDSDGTQQFVGVSRLENTSLNQDVELRIGSAFDIVAETQVLNFQSSGRVRETEFEVTVTNNKSEAVEIEIIRRVGNTNVEILNSSISAEKKDAFTHVFRLNLNSGATERLTFLERIM